MIEIEDCSEALGQLDAMLALWGYTKQSPVVQSYLKAKGVRRVADLSHAQIKALACMLEVAWQKQSEGFKLEMMQLQEWLRVLGLTLDSPPIVAWLRRRGLSSDNIPLEALQTLNAILSTEFENLQVAKAQRWEQQEYGFLLTR